MVFPAGAGVILMNLKEKTMREGVSRRRGGDPMPEKVCSVLPECFPQARG